jgi:hypothetical protein
MNSSDAYAELGISVTHAPPGEQRTEPPGMSSRHSWGTGIRRAQRCTPTHTKAATALRQRGSYHFGIIDARRRIRAQPEFCRAFETSESLDRENLSSGPLCSWTSRPKELAFFVQTEGFFPQPLGFWTSRERLPHRNGALWADPYPKSAPLVTVVLPRTSKLPFFVGAGGIPFFRIPPSFGGMNPRPLDPEKSTYPSIRRK